MCKVSFIIRTYNEALTISKVIEKINAQVFDGDIEIVIVDSESSDDTVTLASKYANVILVPIKKSEWSWGRSLNIGIEKSSGDYIFITSGHCFLGAENFVSCAISSFSFSDSLMAVYGKQVPIEKYDPFEEWELHNWYPNTGFKYITKPHEMVGVSNACSVIRRKGWDLIKYDEDAQSLEDAIWALNILDAGFSIAYSSNFWLYHSHHFEVDYIYRKWFSRVLQSLYFNEKFFSKSFKNTIKTKLRKFTFLFIIKRFIEKRALLKFLNTNYSDVLTSSDVDLFLSVKYSAIINANRCYAKRLSFEYWSVKQDESQALECRQLQKKIRDMNNDCMGI